MGDTVTIQRTVTGADCGEIAITAAEGGIGYWSQIEDYRPSRWSSIFSSGSSDTNAEVDDDFVFYSLYDLDADEAKAQPHDITPDLIRRGIQLFLEGVEHTEAERVERRAWAERALHDPQRIEEYVNDRWQFQPRPFDDMEDLAAMDSAEADCVIQLGLFGKLVYG